MVDIYDYKKRLKSIETNINNSKEISDINKNTITQFKEDCFAHSIGLARTIRYLYCLRDMAVWIDKCFLECKPEDIKKLVARIERDDKYSPRTKGEYKSTLRKLYRFLKNDENPEEISWIRLQKKMHQQKLPSELLNEEDITAMINHTTSLRNRAIIMSLYESGCRIGEFLKMRIKDITFDKYGCLMDVTGKTGGRRIRIVVSSAYLMEWVNKHPDKDNPEAFLWLKNNSLEMLEYPAFCKVLRVAGKRAIIKKKLNPHNFRHSRATQLASKLTEQQLKVFFGWTRASNMASIYVHLSGRDVNESILNLYGIKEEEDKKVPNLSPVKCHRCQFENEPTNKFCKMCGLPLNEEIANKIIESDLKRNQADDVMDRLVNDPEILELIKQKIKG